MLNNYRRNGRLEGHSGPVYCLAATDDGRFLASGGKDGTRTWDLMSMTRISDRPASSGKRGATTALTWANRDDEPGENLFYGTVTGFLICWRKAVDSEITSLAFDALSNRLAVCTYNSLVQLYVLSSAPAPRKLWGIAVNNFLPKSIVFGVMRGNEREILVFGIHDGRIRTFTGSEEADSHLESWEIGTCIGDAIVDNRRVTVCIDDIESGPVLYRLDDHQRIKTFSCPCHYPGKAATTAIVIGSDHGVVYIFDRRSGEVIDKLLMKGQDWVQSIAVRISSETSSLGLQWHQTADCNNIATIFAAKSGDGVGLNDIIMWQKTADRRSPGTIVCEGHSGPHPRRNFTGVVWLCVPKTWMCCRTS
ncbi:WD40-repeat-containing domain protein [Mycena olivaceomarginata]|nr:WD40-repeat-containing domain protein [Mycena olivaceomarginata]